MDMTLADPKGLVRESYAIEGITLGECRSIFLDWALSRPDDPGESVQIAALLAAYGETLPDHPMSQVLRDGLAGAKAPGGRRGGRKARLG